MSTFTSAIASITDPYERQARLWPALLALVPLFVTVGTIYGPRVSALSNVLTLAIACGVLYLLAQMSRDRGKALEAALFAEWGGIPTTQLLRHRDPTIEGMTKSRYHTFLSRKLGQPLPDSQQEAADPKAADDSYKSGVRWLLNHTTDHERFQLLFKENISYGFRRNALGLKPVAILIAMACGIFVLAKSDVVSSSGWNSAAFSMLPEEAWLILVVSLAALVLWTAFITKRTVKSAAFTYAESLLRACDVLE